MSALAARLRPSDRTALALALGGTRVLDAHLRALLGPDWIRALESLSARSARSLAVSLLGDDFFELAQVKPDRVR